MGAMSPRDSARKLAVETFALLPKRSLRHIESAARMAQGKGWGAGTVTREAEAAIQLLPRSERSRPVILDVGANVGDWTHAALTVAPTATVYSFEPSPLAYQSLRRRFDGDARVVPINMAIGEHEGVTRLWSDLPGSRVGSLYKRRLDHQGSSFEHSDEVAITTLDSWLGDQSIHPRILKLDVEGHEMAALRGAANLVELVNVVQFEFGACNIDAKTFFRDFFYYFQDRSFDIFRLGPTGLSLVGRYRELDESFSTTNYFARRSSLASNYG